MALSTARPGLEQPTGTKTIGAADAGASVIAAVRGLTPDYKILVLEWALTKARSEHAARQANADRMQVRRGIRSATDPLMRP